MPIGDSKNDSIPLYNSFDFLQTLIQYILWAVFDSVFILFEKHSHQTRYGGPIHMYGFTGYSTAHENFLILKYFYQYFSHTPNYPTNEVISQESFLVMHQILLLFLFRFVSFHTIPISQLPEIFEIDFLQSD